MLAVRSWLSGNKGLTTFPSIPPPAPWHVAVEAPKPTSQPQWGADSVTHELITQRGCRTACLSPGPTPGLLPKCNVSHCENMAVAPRLWNRPAEMYSHHFLYVYFWPVFHLMAKEVREGITMHMLRFWLLRPMTIPVHTGGHSSGRRQAYFPQGWILRGLTQGC